MIHVIAALVLVLTITLAVAIGVATGYLIISAILNAFARKPRGTKAAPALATQGVAAD